MKKRKVQAIAKSYVKNGFNGAATGMEVYNTTKRQNAKSMINKALKNPQVQNAIQQELDKAGITREYLNQKFKQAIDINIEGKPSQAVLAQLLIQGQKIYNYLPKENKTVIKETRRVLLSKDYDILKQELTQTTQETQELLGDL